MRSLLIAIALLQAGPGQTERVPQGIKGYGAASCAKFAESFRDSPDEAEEIFFAWALGYMSAANIHFSAMPQPTMRNLNAFPLESQKRTVRDYCASNPLKEYIDAVNVLYRSLPIVHGAK